MIILDMAKLHQQNGRDLAVYLAQKELQTPIDCALLSHPFGTRPGNQRADPSIQQMDCGRSLGTGTPILLATDRRCLKSQIFTGRRR